MPRRGESIYKRKDGRWEARYVKEIGIDGKKKYGSVYADSYKAVKDKQQYYLTNPTKHSLNKEDITTSELMQEWLLRNRNQVKKSTLQKYEGLIRNHIEKQLGNIPIKFITSAKLENFSNQQLLNGRSGGGALSRKTVNDILIILGLAFEFAELEYGIPCSKIKYLKDSKKEMRVMSVTEQEIFVNYLLTDIDIYKFGVLLALYTGIRIGELCALCWEDISTNTIRIDKTMQRLKSQSGHTEINIGEPKSESSKRIIPMPTFLNEYILRFRKPCGYVLQNGNIEFVEPRLMQIKFGKMIKECGLPKTNFHALRHTFATRCVESGFDVKSLSEILGHADVKTTLNRYVHSSFELKQSNMEKLSLPISLAI